MLRRKVPTMDLDAYRLGFGGSAMKRAKRAATERSGVTVLADVGAADDVTTQAAFDAEEALVREHATRALAFLLDRTSRYARQLASAYRPVSAAA